MKHNKVQIPLADSVLHTAEGLEHIPCISPCTRCTAKLKLRVLHMHLQIELLIMVLRRKICFKWREVRKCKKYKEGRKHNFEKKLKFKEGKQQF